MVDSVLYVPALGIANTEGMEGANGLIKLEGLPNTRDLGGIKTADGRCIRRRMLLRSGTLAGATERDLKVLREEYCLHTVIDLRTEEERLEKPDPEDALLDVRFVHAPLLSSATLGITREGGLKNAIKMFRALQKKPDQVMVELYGRIMSGKESQRGFATFFNEVLNAEEGSVLWHCTVGKDRVGLSTMLLLHVLGVPQSTILRDYEATNEFVKEHTEELSEKLAAYHVPGNFEESIRVINSANPCFMRAALDTIQQEYGSIDSYVEQAIGITQEQQYALRERYLEN